MAEILNLVINPEKNRYCEPASAGVSVQGHSSFLSSLRGATRRSNRVTHNGQSFYVSRPMDCFRPVGRRNDEKNGRLCERSEGTARAGKTLKSSLRGATRRSNLMPYNGRSLCVFHPVDCFRPVGRRNC